MRTHIHLRAYKPSWIRILDDQHHEEYPLDNLDLSCHFGLLYAIVAHFGLSGLEIEMGYGCPPRSGVGGSGTLGVALAGALAGALARAPSRITNVGKKLQNRPTR
jgi:hypothetical protein